jgi:methylated-DNA-protein-cysteine methyltransferase-like protein
MPKQRPRPGFFARVYHIVRLVPFGQVATYGQIAAIVSDSRAARTVGWALRALRDDTDVPWHRVINAQGQVSTQYCERAALVQRRLLEEEGIVFDDGGRISLERFQWEGLDWPEIETLRRSWDTGSPD